MDSSIGGLHKTCLGTVCGIQISETHYALICNRCHMRIPVPIGIKTHRELREFFIIFQPDDEEQKPKIRPVPMDPGIDIVLASAP